MGFCFIDGNEAVAWGAVAAGCRFFAGYPITPATSIFNEMLRILPPMGGVCLQGEDEIASIGFCLGASMAGMKAMTATSGPGISLYSEQVGFATGSEIPLVIVNVQRLGPSTGSATKGADGDIQFLRWGMSGGLPVIVLAPMDAKDCYILTIHAFNLSERFRCPVFIASNKEIALTRESVDLNAINPPDIINRRYADNTGAYLPFDTGGENRAPDFLPIGGKTIVRQTSSTHGKNGYITTDAKEIQRFQERLENKIVRYIADFTFYEHYDSPGADTLIIAYGVTGRAAKTARKNLSESNIFVSSLILKTLWPVPEDLIREKGKRFRRVVVVEMNPGLYVREIRRCLPGKEVEFIGRMNGELITPEEIGEVIVNG